MKPDDVRAILVRTANPARARAIVRSRLKHEERREARKRKMSVDRM